MYSYSRSPRVPTSPLTTQSTVSSQVRIALLRLRRIHCPNIHANHSHFQLVSIQFQGHSAQSALARIRYSPNYLGIWNANFVSSMANPFDEFAIAPKSVSASSVDFEFKYKANVWRSVKIGFLVCTLPDLKMGSSFLSTYVSMQMWDLCVHPTLSNSYKCRISPTIKNQLLEFSSTDSASMRDRRESKSKSRHDRSSRMGFMLPLPVDLKLISKVSCSHIWCSVLPP